MIAQVVSCHVAGLEPVFRSASMGIADDFTGEGKPSLSSWSSPWLTSVCLPNARVLAILEALGASTPPQTRSAAASTAASPNQVTHDHSKNFSTYLIHLREYMFPDYKYLQGS